MRDESKYRQWKRRDEQRELLGINAERDLLGIPRSPPPKRYDRTATDRKLKSYMKAIRRTQDQLLLAAAAAHQYREVTFATNQGRAIDRMDEGIPRKHRAFEARRDASLSSNEAAARAIKHWFHGERARRRQGDLNGDDDRISLDDSSSDSSSNSSSISSYSGNSSSSFSDGGGGMAMMAKAGGGAAAGKLYYSDGPSAGDPNMPMVPNPRTYNPRRWAQLFGSYFDRAFRDNEAFEQPPEPNIPTGWLTWKEQETQYPTLDKILHVPAVQPEQLFDLPSRVTKELGAEDLKKRPRLELGVITKLSIERGYMAELNEMNRFYRPYSQVPVTQPPKAHQHDMRGGPLPEPPRLPLQGPTGPVIDVGPKPRARIPVRKDWKRALTEFDPDTAKMEIPASRVQYLPSHPEESAVTFPSGKKVAPVFKPTKPTKQTGQAGQTGQTELDATGHLRVSDELRAFGLQEAERKRKFLQPYEYQTKTPRPPPGMSLPQVARAPPPTQEERAAQREEATRKAKMMMGAELHKAGLPLDTLPKYTSGELPPRREEIDLKSVQADVRSNVKRLYGSSSSSSFHHYEKIADSSSSVFAEESKSKAPASETLNKLKAHPRPNVFFGIRNPLLPTQSKPSSEPSSSSAFPFVPGSDLFNSPGKKVHFDDE